MLYPSTYLYERSDWPNFRWDDSALSGLIHSVNARKKELLDAMRDLGFEAQQQTMLDVLVQDVQKSSEIEGERLEESMVRSSIALKLGLDIAGLPRASRDVEGVVEMSLDATQNYREPLTTERLFDWHASLFPTGRSGMSRIRVGAWRDDRLGPMQIVSGPVGRERVHYEAPPAFRLEEEMRHFLHGFEEASQEPILKAALVHLWFELIHPFEDGNGRIGRAIMDMALARADGSSQRFYSMSAQILIQRKDYYDLLERTARASLDITQWIQWFLECLGRALSEAEHLIDMVETKRTFWRKHAAVPINERQTLVLNKLLDGFVGKLQSSKYAKLAKCSPDTALRDLTDLVRKGLLNRDESGGRSTSYSIVI